MIHIYTEDLRSPVKRNGIVKFASKWIKGKNYSERGHLGLERPTVRVLSSVDPSFKTLDLNV